MKKASMVLIAILFAITLPLQASAAQEVTEVISAAQIQEVVKHGEKIVRSKQQIDFILERAEQQETVTSKTDEVRHFFIVSIITISEKPEQALQEKITQLKDGNVEIQPRDSALDPSGTVTAYVDLAYSNKTVNGRKYVRIRNVSGGVEGFSSGVRLVSHFLQYGQGGVGTNGVWTQYDSGFSSIETYNRDWLISTPSSLPFIVDTGVLNTIMNARYRINLSRGTSDYVWSFDVTCGKY